MSVTKFGISITALVSALRDCTDIDIMPLTAESTSMVTLITESIDPNSASLSTDTVTLVTESTDPNSVSLSTDTVTLVTESIDQNSLSLSTNMVSSIAESTSSTVNNNNDGKYDRLTAQTLVH